MTAKPVSRSENVKQPGQRRALTRAQVVLISVLLLVLAALLAFGVMVASGVGQVTGELATDPTLGNARTDAPEGLQGH